MLIAIVGPSQAGKHTIAEYLCRMHAFIALSIGAEPCLDHPSASLCFTSVTELLSYVMMEERWRYDYVICGMDTAEQVQMFRKRPFFLLVSIDAPVTTRFKRLQNSRLMGGKRDRVDDLTEFVNLDDEYMYQMPMMSTSGEIIESSTGPRSAVFGLADVHIINCGRRLHKLYDLLADINLVNPERLRPSWDTYFIHLADLAARRSNCMKRQVGCILTKNRRILSTGYNGTPRSITNCMDGGCARCNNNAPSGIGLDTCLCLHAEENALLEAGRGRMDSLGSHGGDNELVLYCDTCPCLGCAKKIVQCGVQEVVYKRDYGMDAMTKKLFDYAKVTLRRHVPVGLGREVYYCDTEL